MPMISFGGAKHDVWISAIIAAILGLAGAYLIITLGLRYPAQTIIQYSQQILGKGLGKIIGLIYIAFFILAAAIASRDFAELFLNFIFPQIPINAIVGVIILTAAYAAGIGLQGIARSAEILVPYIILIIIIWILASIPNMHYAMILPVLKGGWHPVITDAITELPWLGLMLSWLFLLPSLKSQVKAKQTLLLSIIMVSFITLVISTIIITVLGPYWPVTINYQFYSVFRLISIGEAIQRIETIFLLAWTSTSYLSVALFYYAAVVSAQQWLGLKSKRPLIIPAGIIIFCLSTLLFSSYMELRDFFSLDHFGLIALPVEFGIPLLLLAVSYIRERFS